MPAAKQTQTVTVEQGVEIPTIDDRDLGKYFICVDRHGEVDYIGSDRDAAESFLRQSAKNRNGTDGHPSVFLLEVQGVPTDQALAAKLAAKK